MDPFIGEIRAFPFSFPPRSWALCNGQMLAISTNSALFSILGITYGGNGETTFCLPNLQGRVIVAPGQGPGEVWDWGQVKGADGVALPSTAMPAHIHQITGMNNPGTVPAPNDTCYLGRDVRGGSGVIRYMQTGGSTSAAMATNMLALSGETAPHENRQPFLVMNYCIALSGIWPARN